LIIISFTLRALVFFNFFAHMDDSALIKKEEIIRRDGRKCERVFMSGWLKDMFLASS
jgi:hypothetical protein